METVTTDKDSSSNIFTFLWHGRSLSRITEFAIWICAVEGHKSNWNNGFDKRCVSILMMVAIIMRQSEKLFRLKHCYCIHHQNRRHLLSNPLFHTWFLIFTEELIWNALECHGDRHFLGRHQEFSIWIFREWGFLYFIILFKWQQHDEATFYLSVMLWNEVSNMSFYLFICLNNMLG